MNDSPGIGSDLFCYVVSFLRKYNFPFAADSSVLGDAYWQVSEVRGHIFTAQIRLWEGSILKLVT